MVHLHVVDVNVVFKQFTCCHNQVLPYHFNPAKHAFLFTLSPFRLNIPNGIKIAKDSLFCIAINGNTIEKYIELLQGQLMLKKTSCQMRLIRLFSIYLTVVTRFSVTTVVTKL